jgi:signal transduction histidine kinase/CheY-like chemotaxis protein
MSELNLKYNDRLVTLEFTTADLINANKVKYRYEIEGFNNQWVTTKRNEIVITSLPAGKYRLLVEACNSDGIWNNDAKVLLINVAPPFYFSYWAIMLYILVALVMVLYLIYRGKRRQQVKLEQQINEMKLRFFTNISHDLRTPLTLIITPLQTLLKDMTDDSLKKKLEVMFKNAQQLLSLINSLLDFRKLDVGAEVLHLKPGNIVDLVREIYSSFAVYATERKINFILNSSHENLWVEYDQDKIHKSIMNLLSNAFKYTPNGGIIKLNLYLHETDVCVSVSDNGIGISDEDKKMVFNRFFQTTHNSRKTGSGIGLHIVSEYIKLHNGSIDIADNMPSGCIFILRFPLIETTAISVNPDNDYVEEYQDTQHEELFPQKPFLLFVDDNQDLCEFIHDNLMNDYSVLIANDGKEALVLLKQSDVNIVVSDIMMPVMDGIELCRQIKTNIEWSHIPVILLTAKTADEHKIEGLEIGADDYVTKPFNLDILKLRILKFFEWSLKSHKTFKQKLEVKPSEITITSLDEKLIEKAIQTVEANIDDPAFSVDVLCELLGLSRGHLYRKLMAITAKSPSEFIRLVRLKRGKQLLGKSQLQISEISYQVGFNSPQHFTKKFREEFGMSPSEYGRTLK